MGMYTNTSGFAGSTPFESLLEDTSIGIYDGLSIMEATFQSIAETEQNWNTIQRHIALTELHHFEETGEDFVYTEASGTGFLDTVKSFFKKIVEKIKSLFKKFLAIMGSFFKDDKSFASKYKKQIIAACQNIPTDAEFKGFKYSLNLYKNALGGLSADDAIKTKAWEAITAKCNGVTSDNYTSLGECTNYDSTDVIETLRGKAITGNNGPLTASEFSEEVYKKLRSGEDSKDDIPLNISTVSDALAELETMKKTRSEAKKVYDETMRKFKAFDKTLDNATKAAIDTIKKDKATADAQGKEMTGINRMMTISKAGATMIQTANGIFLSACKEASRQYKAICVKVLTYRKIKESTEYFGEGYDSGSAGDMFAGIRLT